MKRNLLINVRYENINHVAKHLEYRSGQKRIFLADNGSYVFFISFNKSTRNHEVVGYFKVIIKTIDNKNLRGWGKYVIKGDVGKFIKDKSLPEVINKLHIKVGTERSSPKEIGMATQTIRELNEHDKQILLRFIDDNRVG